jgi:hypothetical protein
LVLPLLEHVLGTGSRVEAVCREAMRARASAVCKAAGTEAVTALLARNPRLGAELLFTLAEWLSPAAEIAE